MFYVAYGKQTGSGTDAFSGDMGNPGSAGNNAVSYECVGFGSVGTAAPHDWQWRKGISQSA